MAFFGAYYRGFYCLDELLHGRIKDKVKVVGVVTGEVTVKETKRIWRVWKRTAERRGLVEDLASAHDIEVFKGKVKTPEFYAKLREWDPEVGVIAMFGQLLNEEIFGYPRFGFYNLHPSDLPAYRGPNPFGDMIEAGEEYTRITMHKVDAGIDTGAIVAKSDWIRIPANATPDDMHRITAVPGAKLMASALEDILEGKATLTPQPANPPQTHQEAHAADLWHSGCCMGERLL